MKCAFVSTNSISQGEQVAPLWSKLIGIKGFRISFAHKTFSWSSEARGSAHVHVVIIGFQIAGNVKAARLFEYTNEKGEPEERNVSNISPYLVEGSNIVVSKTREPITQRFQIQKGSEATDFGFLILDDDEKESALIATGMNPKWIRKYWGGKELINGISRYCFWLQHALPQEMRQCDFLIERTKKIAELRAESRKKRTQDWANYPHLFSENRQPSQDYILVPNVSSQRRAYIPMGFVSKDVIVSGSAQFIEVSERYWFALISSSMQMAWMRSVGGRTKSDYQYTNTLVYNTFPLPIGKDLKKLELLG